MFPVKHTVIYTFFAITSVQNTCFCSVFNALASKNPAKSCYVQCFFHFWPFFHCRKATKMTQNSISIPSCAQTPKNPRKMSKTPPYSGLGAKPFLAPPAKADIATAILTNVIEHLVLLFCPPISTPSPPKRCGRIFFVFCFFVFPLVLGHFWAKVAKTSWKQKNDPWRGSEEKLDKWHGVKLFFSMGFGTFVGQGCKNLEKKSFDPRRRSEEKLDRWLEMVPQIHMVNNHKSHVTPSFWFLVLPWFWGILGQTWA